MMTYWCLFWPSAVVLALDGQCACLTGVSLSWLEMSPAWGGGLYKYKAWHQTQLRLPSRTLQLALLCRRNMRFVFRMDVTVPCSYTPEGFIFFCCFLVFLLYCLRVHGGSFIIFHETRGKIQHSGQFNMCATPSLCCCLSLLQAVTACVPSPTVRFARWHRSWPKGTWR